MKIPKEIIKEYVKSENFTNTTDIMEASGDNPGFCVKSLRSLQDDI